jgi:hypothetical protein
VSLVFCTLCKPCACGRGELACHANEELPLVGGNVLSLPMDESRGFSHALVIVFNEGALKQLLGMQDVPRVQDPPHVARVRAAKSQYAWMADPLSWAQRLEARHMARTRLIKASPRFHYRIFVLSHTLSQALRPPLWEHLV